MLLADVVIGADDPALEDAPEAFNRFVQQKTAQLQKDFHCQQVEYVVEVEQGKVRLKAKSI